MNEFGLLEVTVTKLLGPSEIKLMDLYIQSFNKWASNTDFDLIAPGDYQTLLNEFIIEGIYRLESQTKDLNSYKELNEVIA